jgi:hypothetical protein
MRRKILNLELNTSNSASFTISKSNIKVEQNYVPIGLLKASLFWAISRNKEQNNYRRNIISRFDLDNHYYFD